MSFYFILLFARCDEKKEERTEMIWNTFGSILWRKQLTFEVLLGIFNVPCACERHT